MTYSILDPRIHPVYKGNRYEWRLFLKQELLRRRKGVSDLTGRRLWACEMHEGIITRAMVPKSIWWHDFIFHEYNSFLLLPEEHRPQPPSKEWCINRAYELYGKDVIKEWFYSLPFKVIPFQLS